MPAVVPYIAAFVGNVILAVGGTTAFANAVIGAIYWATSLQGLATIAAFAYSLSAADKSFNLGDLSHRSPMDVRPEVNAPAMIVVGETGIGGTNPYATTHTSNEFVEFVISLSDAGPIEGLVKFLLDNEEALIADEADPMGVPPVTLHQIVDGKYAHRMWMEFRQGVDDEPAFVFPGILEWTSGHKLSNVAHARWAMKYDPGVYTVGLPRPTWVVRGVKCYDPRLDSTYPGGSGAHRADDESTWEWTQNGGLIALTYAIGWRRGEDQIRVAGLGAQIEFIHVPDFVTAANVCDANGWTCNGVLYDTDRVGNMRNICATFGGEFTPRAGKLGVTVAAAADSVIELTDDDLAGSIALTSSRPIRERYNQATGYYVNPEEEYTFAPCTVVAPESYLDEDNGRVRHREDKFPLVDTPEQARQLTALKLASLREHVNIAAAYKPRARLAKEGQCVDIVSATLGISGQFRVRRRALGPDGSVELVLRSETAGKYSYALGLTDEAPTPSVINRYDPADMEAPDAEDWDVEPVEIDEDGFKYPVLRITGTAPVLAAAIVVEYKPAHSSVWRTAGAYPRSFNQIDLRDVAPAVFYDVALSYRVAGTDHVTGRLIIEDVLSTASFTATETLTLGEYETGELIDIVETNAAAQALLEELVEDIDWSVDTLTSEIDIARARIVNADGQIVAQASAISALDARVTETEGDIGAVATSLSSLTTTVGANTASITTINTSIDGVEARATLALDVNGRVTGYYIAADDTTTDVVFIADKFFIIDPGNDLDDPFIPFAVVDGVVYMHDVEVNTFAAGSILASHINVTTLSAITADVGELTAGVIKSADDKMVIDLDAGTIVISD